MESFKTDFMNFNSEPSTVWIMTTNVLDISRTHVTGGLIFAYKSLRQCLFKQQTSLFD